MTRKPEIAAAEARIVRDVLAESLPAGCKVRVFGSRATGRVHRGSDLDLALEGPAGPLPAVTLSRLKDAFTESRLPYRVDLVDLSAVSEDFRSRIRRQAVPFSFGSFSSGVLSRRV
ncbi:MAG: nucleotidyltransferase domain-containing protein [Rhodospirillales bacterium]|nr:nucleotidyltransferase domain-containing protein [Rhodospirillales bacterium]